MPVDLQKEHHCYRVNLKKPVKTISGSYFTLKILRKIWGFGAGCVLLQMMEKSISAVPFVDTTDRKLQTFLHFRDN